MPHPLPHPPAPRRTLVTSAACALAAAAGCTSAPAATSKATTSASGAAATAVRITGAWSTFDAPFIHLAFGRYQRDHRGVTISYAAVGSSAGITAFTSGSADSAPPTSRPAPPTSPPPAARPFRSPWTWAPWRSAYNMPVLRGGPLKLTAPCWPGSSAVRSPHWNDPAIIALNPGAGLPDAWITVVHRSDGSGTTYIFSNYLSAVSLAWAAQVGTGRSLRWPAGYAAPGNSGVAAAIARIPGSIGYVERSYTSGTSLATAAIQNQAGTYTTPAPGAITAAAAGKPAITPTDFSIVNQPGPAAYPICGYSWVLISAR